MASASGKASTDGRWVIDEATFAAPEAAVAGAPARAPRPRPGAQVRDEVYVVDLSDEMFGSTAARQHRFDWLRGQG